MTQVIVSDQIVNTLRGLGGTAELRTAAGEILGFFQPVGSKSGRSLDLGIPEEEIKRRQQIRTGRTLKEILDDLEKRP